MNAKRLNLTIVVLLFTFCTKANGQTFGIDRTKDVGAPISELPKSVAASKGEVILVADFKEPQHGPISVYLINQSDQDLILQAEGGDVYLKLETKTKDGHWVRAQPHEFSWCGNSYLVRPKIKKGHFYKINGYQPENGEKALVRYHLYLQNGLDLVTAEGIGYALESDVLLASKDMMAICSGTLEFVESIAFEDRIIVNDKKPTRDLQSYAIVELGSGRFPKEQVTPILDRLEKKFPDRTKQIEYARQRLDIDLK